MTRSCHDVPAHPPGNVVWKSYNVYYKGESEGQREEMNELFIMNRLKRELKIRLIRVSVLYASHTLCCSRNWNT